MRNNNSNNGNSGSGNTGNNYNRRIALLIDADNVSSKYIKGIIDEISVYGTPTYKRIYGDWTSPNASAWKSILLSHSITPIQQFRYTVGKNASDSALIIDAMDILYSDQVDGFCIVSSDSDFTKLASRLREAGMFVLGMGEKKTPLAFKSACEVFKYLEVLVKPTKPVVKAPVNVSKKKTEIPDKKAAAASSPTAAPVSAVPASASTPAATPASSAPASAAIVPSAQVVEKPVESAHEHAPEHVSIPENETGMLSLEAVVENISKIIDTNSDDDGWMFLSQIGIMLNRQYPDFDPRNYNYSKLVSLIKDANKFEAKAISAGNGISHYLVKNHD
jgi:uncharacterized LabA/DUF88 family protein/Fe-S-cluster formation regulator IscX/YfhJ